MQAVMLPGLLLVLGRAQKKLCVATPTAVRYVRHALLVGCE